MFSRGPFAIKVLEVSFSSRLSYETVDVTFGLCLVRLIIYFPDRLVHQDGFSINVERAHSVVHDLRLRGSLDQMQPV